MKRYQIPQRDTDFVFTFLNSFKPNLLHRRTSIFGKYYLQRKQRILPREFRKFLKLTLLLYSESLKIPKFGHNFEFCLVRCNLMFCNQTLSPYLDDF